jgi:hypothetical protein
MNRQAGFGIWHEARAAALLCCPAYGKAQAPHSVIDPVLIMAPSNLAGP